MCQANFWECTVWSGNHLEIYFTWKGEHFWPLSEDLWGFFTTCYTCQLSRLRRESHACGLKTSISRLLTPAGQFLTPDWKMWVVAVLLDTISKNMSTQTYARNENHMYIMTKWQYLPRDLWFLKWKALGSELAFILGLGLRTFSEDFGILRKTSDFIGDLWKWSCRLQKS